MFDKLKVISGLNGVVGWRQPYDPASPILTAENLAASSGYTFDENPFVKVSSLKSSQDYALISDPDFNSFLADLQNTAIANVVNSVFDNSDYIDRQVVFKNANNKKNTEILPDGFVGYKIEITDDKDYAFEITRVILEFSGTGDINLMLFNSANPDPIESKQISITSALQEEQLNWVVNNTDIFYKGEFYIGYLTTGMNFAPFSREYESSNIISNITGLAIEPIEVLNHTTGMLFDLDSVDGASECWGLNFDISVYDDYTDLVIQNKSLFAKAIQMQGQIEAISIVIAATRSNKTERQSNSNINKMIVELDGLDSDVKIVGLRQKLFGEVGRIRKEIRKLKENYHSFGFIVNSR